MNNTSRRDFLQLAGAGAALWTGGSLFNAAAALAAAAPTATALGGGLQLLHGDGTNVLAFGSATDGLLLVDGGSARQASAFLKAGLKATGARQLRVLFNTHWHPQQTGLNAQAAKAGARLIAHENTRLWLTRKIVTDWLPQGYGPLPKASQPGAGLYTRDTLEFGGETLEFGHLGQAHTDGDLYVHFRKANVLAAGGVVTTGAWPVMDWQTGGWIGGFVGGIDRLLKVANEETKIVGASGAVITRAQLQVQREQFYAVFDRLVKLLVKGQGPDEVVAAKPAKDLEAQWGDSDVFVRASFKSLWGHYAPDA